MSREILFRGKRLDNGEWVEGFYARHIKRQVCPLGDSLKPEDEEHLICFDSFADLNMPKNLLCTHVDASTVCQSTGLTDKTGKRIWENDIVIEKHCTYSRKYHVLWDDEEGSWHLEGFSCARYSLGDANSENYEVIGNIFDNPELLEVEHE